MKDKDRIKRITSKDPLEQSLIKGQGVAELGKEEKKVFLGQFKERVIAALTIAQLHQAGTYPEINQAIQHSNATKLIINRRADLDRASEYIALARQYGLKFTTVTTNKDDTDLGLVVSADDAVDIDDIYVEDIIEKLEEAHLDPKLADAVGEKICPKCYKKIEQKSAPITFKI